MRLFTTDYTYSLREVCLHLHRACIKKDMEVSPSQYSFIFLPVCGNLDMLAVAG